MRRALFLSSNADCMHMHLYTQHNVGNHHFVLIGLAWQWRVISESDCSLPATHLNNKLRTAVQPITYSPQQPMLTAHAHTQCMCTISTDESYLSF